jgi:hypothetical protein
MENKGAAENEMFKQAQQQFHDAHKARADRRKDNDIDLGKSISEVAVHLESINKALGREDGLAKKKTEEKAKRAEYRTKLFESATNALTTRIDRWGKKEKKERKGRKDSEN